MHKGRIFEKPKYLSIAGGRNRIRNRNRITDVQNRLIDTKGGGGQWDELGGWE